MHERYTSPEQNIPSWEEILSAAIVRKVMAGEDLDEVAARESISYRARWFATPDGRELWVYGTIEWEEHPVWRGMIMAAPAGSMGTDWKADYTLCLGIAEDGTLELTQAGGKLPLPDTATQHVLGTFMLSKPLNEANSFGSVPRS